ncbi:pantoate--beta-alanine ligase [Pedobacter xixiisoli]|uniref:Pantothenate synthetase n=1 Tax=Pedobacter xixiisoli TaxID=1476464 RepID=A0A286ADB2_9SPHI|nr:pantoate--beta-alanine ligase [Pedobacter xixiisoli]SOD19891.1 pantoate--beta-alanine ligase [Pedobacter xixiisoli]
MYNLAASKQDKILEVIATVAELESSLKPLKAKGLKIALVPTMGALHNGHLSLIAEAQKKADIVVCSIFVNPTQFTDPKDLEKYPRPLEHDIKMLTEAGCNFVFMPAVKEMYPNYPTPENWAIDLGSAEFVLEGEFRKGHYQGVTQIVFKLFDAVKPDVAFFGQKDFQQVLMIKNMVAVLNLEVQIVTCPIIRENDGLAMSSRNIHLSEADRAHSLVLSKALFFIEENYADKSIAELLAEAKAIVNTITGVELDYLTIVDGDTLLPIKEKTHKNTVALVAAKVGETRLIDNVIIN